MNRIAIVVCFLALAGCRRSAPESTRPAGAGENLTGQQRVVGATPVLQRMISDNDLYQLKLLIEQSYTETNKYPKSIADLPGLSRDAPKIAQYINDGDLVLVGGVNGVLAYAKVTLEKRGSVLLTSGVQQMEPDELKKLLGR